MSKEAKAPEEPSIGDKIRRARLSRGLSVQDLAKKSGVNRASIHRIERNDRKQPHASTVAKLTKALAKIPKLPEI